LVNYDVANLNPFLFALIKLKKMKKLSTIVVFVTLFAFSAFSQLPNGSTAPDWTMMDINGVEHHLYEYLEDGYTVVIDFSATWCGPCWSYHNSGALEELYINHGPAGMPNVSPNTTDDVMVFMIEGDANTTSADLNGTGSSTTGDWVTGTPYPIIDDASMTSAYQIGYWPTIYTVCSNGIINESGQTTTEAHYALAIECAIASLDYQAENTSASSFLGIDSDNQFTLNIINNGDSAEELRITLSSNEPPDWSSTITSGGNTDATSVDITVDGGADASVSLDVVPGTSAALADYNVEIESLTNPDNVHIVKTYSFIAGISDLVLDNGDRATQWNALFESGLEAANNESHGVVGIEKFVEGMEAEQLSEIEHVYFNVAWTFPSLTNENVAALTNFLDNGGNLFVSGQDIGWDTWDASGNGTNETKAFYTDYLSADYQSDGSSANNQLTWETEDGVFGEAQVSAINDIYDGNIYPEEIDPVEPAVAIYHYNTNETKVGGIRVEENGHKVVYIGIDLAMIADQSVQDQTMQLTHDWFHGLITSAEFDEAFKQSVGQIFPNPTNEFTTIPFENLQEDVILNIVNTLGQTILTKKINKGTSSYSLDLSILETGLYHCVLINDVGSQTVLPIEIVK
jgi:hypothetical protein